ncbi:Alpha/Beta hydrolase protein [Cubamyces lactineus]|nr:Alpha/Beta hydrolase protein [Cubamyces lactineus]
MASATPQAPNTAGTTALRAFLDSGAPEGSTDYTTVVVLHGWGWHGGVFRKLLPLAAQSNARVVLVNRRDYPGSEPYTPEQRATLVRLASAAPSPETDAEAQAFFRDLVKEFYDFLVDFVRRENIPRPQGETGGLIIAGWSLASAWLTALLASVGLFREEDVHLSEYVRRVILFDSSHFCYGFAPPPNSYQPLLDASLSEEERVLRFGIYITGYYAHGDVWADGPSALEFRTPLADPSPTGSRMTPEELAETTSAEPQVPGGSEGLLAQMMVAHGVIVAAREGAFYPKPAVEGASNWENVEVRHLWCDRSVWEMPWGTKRLTEEIEEAKKAGKHVRDVVFARLKGGNHFAQWDMPEKTLQAFLTKDTVVE